MSLLEEIDGEAEGTSGTSGFIPIEEEGHARVEAVEEDGTDDSNSEGWSSDESDIDGDRRTTTEGEEESYRKLDTAVKGKIQTASKELVISELQLMESEEERRRSERRLKYAEETLNKLQGRSRVKVEEEKKKRKELRYWNEVSRKQQKALMELRKKLEDCINEMEESDRKRRLVTTRHLSFFTLAFSFSACY